MNEHDEFRLRQLISEAAGAYWSMNQRKGYTLADYAVAERRILAFVNELLEDVKCPKATPYL